jgi:glycosyltransferase involved in cell wall biosynthesis
MLSVIICTYNNAGKLRQALKSLAGMSTPAGLQWELIVVDNNSSDGTKEVVQNSKKSFGLDAKYVFEAKQGLSNARNRGMLAATGEYVAFTDDDCIVDHYWVHSILDEFSHDPELAVLGGRVELYDKRDRAVTVRTRRDRALLTSANQLYTLRPGCNMVFTRSVFNVVGEFDPELGAGTKYSPTVLVYHNHGRRTDAQVAALNRGYVIGRGAFYCKHILKRDRVIFKLACQEMFNTKRRLIKNYIDGKSIKQEIKLIIYLLMGALYRITYSRSY